MWTESKVFCEDLEQICAAEYIPWEQLRGKSVFVTGATGLIGSALVSALLYAELHKSLGLSVIALVRSVERAKEQFRAQLDACAGTLHFVEGTVEQLPLLSFDIDLIVHGASPTASSFFVTHPVETIQTAVLGTSNLLQLANEKKVQSILYLSSMEIYGSPHTDAPLKEADVDYMNPLVVRNCYPESKRICENLCVSFHSEYGVPVKMIRLAQTFGPGVAKNDVRAFAQFARSAAAGEDIVLLTKGESRQTYLYTMDAVGACLAVLLKGKPGAAYNAANMETYCSIFEMAKLVAETIGNGRSNVKIAENKQGETKYPPTHHYLLDTALLQTLGWRATISLSEMYRRMIAADEVGTLTTRVQKTEGTI